MHLISVQQLNTGSSDQRFTADSYWCVWSWRHLNSSSSLSLCRPLVLSLCSSSLALRSSLPNWPPSAQLFICSYYNSGNRALSGSAPLKRARPASAANLLSKGQEGPSLARCLMGSDSSVFWDYTIWKGGHSSSGSLCLSAATVCFWQDSCSKASRPPRAALRERTQGWLPLSGVVIATFTWEHGRRSLDPALRTAWRFIWRTFPVPSTK